MGAVHFHAELVEMLPRLRRIGLAMTRNRSRADDLVQDTVAKALAAADSFVTGTNLGAWLYRILRNQFISDCRRTRRTVPIEDAGEAVLGRDGAQESNVMVKDLLKMLGRIPTAQCEALLLVTLEGLSYKEVARYTDSSIGTAKSRVFRAREKLSELLEGKNASDGDADFILPGRPAPGAPIAPAGREAPSRRDCDGQPASIILLHARADADFARKAGIRIARDTVETQDAGFETRHGEGNAARASRSGTRQSGAIRI